jgi:murein L,D-transpeptidase YcbB/YkuD
MKTLFIYGCIVCFLFQACSSSASKDAVHRDTSITAESAQHALFFDSSDMEAFISKQAYHDSLAQRLRNFYNGRNYQCAWFFKDGIAEYAATFYQMQEEYIGYSGDSSLINPLLQQLYDSIQTGNLLPTDSMTLKAELLLTAQFFRYSRKAYQGNNNLDAKALDWFIPRKKINTTALLDSLLKNRGKNIDAYEPISKQYNLLKTQLQRYYTINKQGNWPVIKADKNKYQRNDSAAVLRTIKQLLMLTGDLQMADTSALFTAGLEAAVKVFQRRFGYAENGIINTVLITEMNRPIQQRLQQILINMERLRWMPLEPSTDYLLVNIPEFKLHVFEKGKEAFSMNVVTGTAVNNTVIFSGSLKHVVFSPYWNVPSSILQKEFMPGIRRNKNYLSRQNMEWYAGGVRQKPGKNNSLGQVKFLFPNSYNIYLHDTPSKHLFEKEKRAFSHGCIRVAEPAKLAEYLLRNDAAWNKQTINAAMNAGKEKYVNVKEQIPVFIVYLTAWVDQDGKLCFRNDIYGHDKKMAERLFK